MPTPARDRPFDVIVWGATGYTGRLVAEYLLRAAPTLRLALGGRSRAKLVEARARIARAFPAIADVPLRIAEASDRASLAALVAETRVLCSTVGPFALHGGPVVRACIEQGTDYCDSSGEPPFVRAMIDRHHRAAVRAKVRIVPCCGFDSIPSDLGMLMLAEHARRRGRTLGRVRFFLGPWRGVPSGGSGASMIQIVDDALRDPAVREILTDPYSLSPDRAHDLDLDAPEDLGVRYDHDLQIWTAPFAMAVINSRIVRRSNALTGHAYGKHLRYSEALSFRGDAEGFVQATVASLGTIASTAAAAFSPMRPLLLRVLPPPGEGPSRARLDRGFFKTRFYARLDGDRRDRLLGRVEGKQDPGYLETARMLGESALCLAHDPPRPGFEGGVLTPATAMGLPLIERLRRAGMIFTVERLR